MARGAGQGSVGPQGLWEKGARHGDALVAFTGSAVDPHDMALPWRAAQVPGAGLYERHLGSWVSAL